MKKVLEVANETSTNINLELKSIGGKLNVELENVPSPSTSSKSHLLAHML